MPAQPDDVDLDLVREETGLGHRERPQGIAHRDDLVDRCPVVQRDDGAEAPAGPRGPVVDQSGGHDRVGDRQQRVVGRSQPGRAEADALDHPLHALDGDVLADPERVLADQQKCPEEILERILGRERRGQTDQAEPGQELGERLTAADQIDLARYGDRAGRIASGRWRPSARSCR